MFKVLLTCPPMIGMVEEFGDDFQRAGFDIHIPDFTQEMLEDDLVGLVGSYDGWIIGDDPASERVVVAGSSGKLKACVRWGVGTDNVDFSAFEKYGIAITNTPGVFGREVADLATHYVTGLARQTFLIDKNVKMGDWFKPIGKSLWASKCLIVGLGDIGRNLATRLIAHGVDVSYCDPAVDVKETGLDINRAKWPEGCSNVDFVIFTAPLNAQTFHMFDERVLDYIQQPIYVVNVGRGPIIKESALIAGLGNGKIKGAALDVFESEPYNPDTHGELKAFSDRLILGSHNGSNTKEAVAHVSRLAILKLSEFLKGAPR